MKSRIIVTLMALCFFVVSQAQEAPFTRNINQEGLRALDLMNNSDLTFARESGPLVLIANDIGGWGDISYAKIVAEIVNHHRPDIDIKIIIVRSQKPLSKINNFFSGIEGISEISNTVLERDIENLIEKNISSPSLNWLKSASLIIQLSTCASFLKRLEVPYICLNEIGSEHENNTYTTLKIHINYARKWSRKLGIEKKLPREFDYFFLNFYSDISVGKSKIFNDVDSLHQPDPVIRDKFKSFLSEQKKQSREHGALLQSITDNIGMVSVDFGFSKRDIGIPVSPSLYIKAWGEQDSDQLKAVNFTEEYNQALENQPFIKQAMIESDNIDKFYMAYYHRPLYIANFISTVTLYNAPSPPLILVTGCEDIDQIKDPDSLMAKYIKANNVGKVHYINLAKNKDLPSSLKFESLFFDLSSEKEAYVVNLAELNSREFIGLMALSDEIIGVTGNHSLFQALTLGKFPIYESYFSSQAGITHQLARFKHGKKLVPALTYLISPSRKAKILRKIKPFIVPWAKDIITTQSANGFINKLIEQINARNSKTLE